MHTEKLRGMFADFLESLGIRNMLVIDSCTTIDQDANLKYERLDRYRALFLTQKEIKSLMRFCEKHGIAMWFGAEKLCIGFNYKGCQRLSAYDSVQLRELAKVRPVDIINSVSPEISAAEILGDRIEPDHHLDVHGGLD